MTLLEMLSNKPGMVVLAALCLMLVPASASAQIYSTRDANGQIVLGNVPRPAAGQVVEAIVRTIPAPPKAAAVIPPTSRTASDRIKMYDGLISEQARLHDIRPDLIRAVVQVESAYNPYARSPKGASGLMQLMPGTAQQFGVKNAFNPEENVRAGVAYLRQLLDRYENNEELALAAYNAGPKAVDKYGEKVPPYAETKNYVFKINGLTARPIERRDSNRIYKVTEIIDGREVVRYTDKVPAKGTYTVLGR